MWPSLGDILSIPNGEGGRSSRFCLLFCFRGGCVYFKDVASNAATAALRFLGSGNADGGAMARAGLWDFVYDP
jgi:hypothetical protein